MTRPNRPIGSWEKTRDEVHSPKGVDELRKNVKWGLLKKYVGLAETMFQHNIDGPLTEDMRAMSRDELPEKYLMRNGACVWFMYAGQLHCLPFAETGTLNIYGKPVSWHPVPYAYNPDTDRGQNQTRDDIYDLELDLSNSVIMRNDIFSGSDYAFIESMVNELVDNVLTTNQLQLLAKMPYVWKVSENNLMTAKNIMLAICEDRPAIFLNSAGEDVNLVEQTHVPIDPAIFEIFDRFECLVLEQIGFPCTPITKRAQQSVSEVESNDDKLSARRKEKLWQREKAYERINAMFGTSFSVVSIVDSMQDNEDMDEDPEDDNESEVTE